MSIKFHIILLVIFTVLATKLKAEDKRDYHIELIHTSTIHNASSFVKDVNCRLRSLATNHTQNVLDCYAVLAQTINAFDLNVAVHCYPKNMRRWTLINMRTNGCDFFHIIHRQRVFRAFVETFKKYSNIKDIRCPFKKDFNYTLTGFRYDESMFPTYVPAGEYLGVMDFITKNNALTTVRVRGVVSYNGKKG